MNLAWIVFSVLLPFSGLLHSLGLGYYAPGALVVLAPLGVIEFFSLLSRRELKLWHVLLFVFLAYYGVSAALLWDKGLTPAGLIATRVAATFIGALALLGIARLFKRSTPEDSSRWLMMGVDVTLLFLLLELLVVTGSLPFSVKEKLNMLFAGRSTFRLQGPAQEASFIAAYLGTLFPIAVFHFRSRRTLFSLLRLLAMGGMLIAITSLQGLIVWAGGLFAGLAYIAWKYPKRSLVPAFSAVLLVIGGLISAAFVVNESQQGGYVASRINKLKEIRGADELLFLDYSVFNRITAPYYGLKAGVTHPLGLGPGGYGAYYNAELSRIQDDRAEELLKLRPMSDAEDTKSLIIQYFAESGFVSIVLFASFFLCWRARLRSTGTFESRVLAFALLGTFAAMALNGGSMLNLIFWICLVPYSSPDLEPDIGTETTPEHA